MTRESKSTYKVSMYLRVLTNPIPEKIIDYLKNNKWKTGTEIYTSLRLPQSQISTALKQLIEMGVVGMKKEGRTHYYYIVHDVLVQIEESCNDFIKKFKL